MHFSFYLSCMQFSVVSSADIVFFKSALGDAFVLVDEEAAILMGMMKPRIWCICPRWF